MNLKKLNEELDKLLMHELSDETRQWAKDERTARYLAAQATADREKEKLDKTNKRLGVNDLISTKDKSNLILTIGTDDSNIETKETEHSYIIVITDVEMENGELTKSAEEKLKQLLEEMSKKYGCKYTYKVTGTKVEIICEKPKIANSNEYTFADWYGEDLTGQTYEGDLNCSDDSLTSLQGAPIEVNGSFFCDHNNLTSLKGAPKYVHGSFFCHHNNLTTLEGSPQEIDGTFWCDYNKLTTLEGAPIEVGEDFWCDYNKLTSLKGAPEKVGGDFSCEHNNLTTLDGIGEVEGKIYSNIEK